MKRLLTITAITASASLVLASAAAVAVQTTNGSQSFGWTVEVPPADLEQLDRPLTELERLSLSASGTRLGNQFYDARSDNPLDPVSVTLRALDKITAQYTDITIEIDDTIEFGTLQITARTCDKRPPEEFPETTAFLEIAALGPVEEDLAEVDTASGEQPVAPEVNAEDAGNEAVSQEAETSAYTDAISFDDGLEAASGDYIFSGWMFASSPALNALQHAVYDVWVIDCKMVDPSAG